MMETEQTEVRERFWGVSVRAETALRIELPERCALCVRNACLARGTAATLSLQVDGAAPMLLATLTAAAVPMAALEVDVPAGSSAVLVCDGGNGEVDVTGHTRRTITEEDYAPDEDEDDGGFGLAGMPFDQIEDEDEEEEEEEEEEKPKGRPGRDNRNNKKRAGRR